MGQSNKIDITIATDINLPFSLDNYSQYYQRNGVKYLRTKNGDRVKMYWVFGDLIIESI